MNATDALRVLLVAPAHGRRTVQHLAHDSALPLDSVRAIVAELRTLGFVRCSGKQQAKLPIAGAVVELTDRGRDHQTKAVAEAMAAGSKRRSA